MESKFSRLQWMVIFLIFISATMEINCDKKNMPDQLSVNVPGRPYSTDPKEFDYLYHFFFSSVWTTLVTDARVGEYVPVLAESWSVSDDYKTWKFKIRKDLMYETGEKINIEDIIKSWTRLAYLLKINASRVGFLEDVIGFSDLMSPTNEFKGLKKNKNELIINLNKPKKDLLEKLSFGLFAIIHPSQYDHKTGEWTSTKKLISSGPYTLKWGKDKILLKLRSNYPKELLHHHPFNEIIIHWEKKGDNSDIIVGDSLNNKLKNSHIFYGSSSLSIGYAHCTSWSNKNSPFYDLKTRKYFRSIFYKELENKQHKVIRSFFPTTIENIKEKEDPPITYGDQLLKKNTKINFLGNISPLYHKLFDEPLYTIAKKLSLELKNLNYTTFKEYQDQKIPNLSQYKFDIIPAVLMMYTYNPYEDVRFMFLAKEGARLSDLDGSIKEIIQEETFDLEKVNQKIWDQAMIWPLIHYSYGVWAIKGKKLDMAEVNTLLPHIQLQWVGHGK